MLGAVAVFVVVVLGMSLRRVRLLSVFVTLIAKGELFEQIGASSPSIESAEKRSSICHPSQSQI